MKTVILKDKNGVPIYPLANANYKREPLNKAYLNEYSMKSICDMLSEFLNELDLDNKHEVDKIWNSEKGCWDFSITTTENSPIV